jgi:hypothetical protein
LLRLGALYRLLPFDLILVVLITRFRPGNPNSPWMVLAVAGLGEHRRLPLRHRHVILRRPLCFNSTLLPQARPQPALVLLAVGRHRRCCLPAWLRHRPPGHQPLPRRRLFSAHVPHGNPSRGLVAGVVLWLPRLLLLCLAAYEHYLALPELLLSVEWC